MAYNQIELDEDSRYITIFIIGLFRYIRLNFGITSASEFFQKVVEKVLNNVENISDDIIVFGESQEEHDTCLHLVLKLLEDCGFLLLLNIDKCKFSQNNMDFFGLHFSSAGIQLKQLKFEEAN